MTGKEKIGVYKVILPGCFFFLNRGNNAFVASPVSEMSVPLWAHL